MADVAVINKMDSASPKKIQEVRENIEKVAPNAIVVDAASPLKVDKPENIRDKKVLVVEDGPTLTHGGMKLGAGTVAARKYGASELVDPRPFLVGKLKETFDIYPGIGVLLPAMGYSDQQLADLETTINNSDADSVIIGTPIDLSRVINIKKPVTRVHYDLQEIGDPNLETILEDFIKKHNLVGSEELV
jgi:predicted GTPase